MNNDEVAEILTKTIVLIYCHLRNIPSYMSFYTLIDRYNESYNRPESPSKQLITIKE